MKKILLILLVLFVFIPNSHGEDRVDQWTIDHCDNRAQFAIEQLESLSKNAEVKTLYQSVYDDGSVNPKHPLLGVINDALKYYLKGGTSRTMNQKDLTDFRNIQFLECVNAYGGLKNNEY